MKNSMHKTEKTPFQKSGKTPMPKTGTHQAAHKTAGGNVKKFTSANSAMKSKS